VLGSDIVGDITKLQLVRQTTNNAGQTVRQVRDTSGKVIEYVVTSAGRVTGVRVLQGAAR
jgi:YD repeat-containing protein